MSSKKVEDLHDTMLDQLIDSTGLSCIKPVPTPPEFEEDEVPELATTYVEEEEVVIDDPQVVEEEVVVTPIELKEEELIFPTPSLRRVVPEKLRKIETMNCIPVLPDKFKTEIDPEAIPKIQYTPEQKYIDILAEMTGCKRYKTSLAEYWFLDTLADMLRRAQADLFDTRAQAALIEWFCEWMKEMQNFDAASRHRMLARWKDNMLNAARHIGEGFPLPTPKDIGVSYKAEDQKSPEPQRPIESPSIAIGHAPPPSEVRINSARADKKSSNEHDRKKRGVLGSKSQSKVGFGSPLYECSLMDLARMLHYLYDLFSSDFQYNLVRAVFTFTPEYAACDAPYQIELPKHLYAPLTKVKGKSASEFKAKSKIKMKESKTKIKPLLPQDYVQLQEFKALDELRLQEQEENDQEQYNLRRSILPLARAVDDSFFQLYWHAMSGRIRDPEPAESPIKK